MADKDTIERSASRLGDTLRLAGRELRRARTTFGSAHEPAQRLGITVVACLAACLGVFALMHQWGDNDAAPIDYVEFPTMDLRVRMLETNEARDPDILLLNIDEQALHRGDTYTAEGIESIGSRYAWPWPRHVYNRIIRYCREGGARMVVFDLVLSDSGANTNSIMHYDADGMPVFTFERGGDDLLTMEATAKEDVLIALMLSTTGRAEAERDRLLPNYSVPLNGPEAEAQQTLRESRYADFRSADAPFRGLLDGWPEIVESGRDDPEEGWEDLAALREMIHEDPAMQGAQRLRSLLPITEPERIQGVAGVGVIMGFGDVDGVLRRYDIVGEFGDHTYPTLPLDMWRVFVLGHAREALENGKLDEFNERFPGLELTRDGLRIDGRLHNLADSLRDVPVHFERGGASYLGRFIPLDETGRMRLRYRNYIDYRDLPLYQTRPERLDELYAENPPPFVYAEIGVSNVLRDWDLMTDNKRRIEQGLEPYELEFEHPSELVKDKIVIVAGTAQALYDRHPTPLSSTTPGTWVLATAFDNIKNDDFMAVPPRWVTWLYVLTLTLIAVLTVMYFKRVSRAALVNFVIAALVVFAAWVAFKQQVFLHMTGPIAALFVGASMGSLAKALTEGRQKRQREYFARQYMGKELLDYVIKHPGTLKLGGENREMTVFFNDVAGFTTVTETLGAENPERLVALLNIYLERMTDVMLETGAVIDKYIGDAIMCFWGAPMDMQDHAVRACQGALRCRTELNRMQSLFADAVRGVAPQLIKPDGTVLYARAGINSGLMTVGNMGSSKRFAYTVMGDAVNLAARLEPQCKDYGTDILIGENTEKLIRGEYTLRPIDLMVVKGKTEPVEVFELIGEKEVPQFVHDLLEHYLKAIELFRDQQFEAALEAFKLAEKLEANAEDKGEVNPSRLYIARCEDLIANPPASDWNGVYIKTSK
jgi:class 3 adenylate cyclase